MPVLPHPIKVPTRSEYFFYTRQSIKAFRSNLIKKTSPLVRGLQGFLSPEDVSAFLQDCGMSDDEIDTILTLNARSDTHEKILQKHSLGYDAMAVLAKASDDELQHAISLINAKGGLGEKELKHLRAVPEDARISDHDDLMNRREQEIQERSLRRATERAQLFVASVGQLYGLLKEYENRHSQILSYQWQIECDEFSGEEEIEKRRQAWPKVQTQGEIFLDLKMQEITDLAQALILEFDYLFPDAFVPKEDWLLVGETDPIKQHFAESRHALWALGSKFVGALPVETWADHTWSSFDSIAFLAGRRYDSKRAERYAPRAVPRLNAISVCVASGAEALGLDAAGFRIRAADTSTSLGRDAVQLNRGDWKVSNLDLKGGEIVVKMKEEKAALGRPIHLIAGVLNDQPFKETGEGEHDPRQQFSKAVEIIKAVEPESFFFETAAEFLDPGRIEYRHKLRSELQNLGFVVPLPIILDAIMFGIPQSRVRTVFIGVRADKLVSPLRRPLLAHPIKRTVSEAIVDVAFPDLQKGLTDQEHSWTEAHTEYASWVCTWLRAFGEKEFVPDTMSIVRKHYLNEENWSDKNGFRADLHHVMNIDSFEKSDKGLPLSIPILKRLQGIPDDWEFVGSDKEQREQICSTIPPVISRVVAHVIHSALTGEIVDLDQAARAPIKSGRSNRATSFQIPLGFGARHAKALQWKEEVEFNNREDFGFTNFHPVNADPMVSQTLIKRLNARGTQPYVVQSPKSGM